MSKAKAQLNQEVKGLNQEIEAWAKENGLSKPRVKALIALLDECAIDPSQINGASDRFSKPHQERFRAFAAAKVDLLERMLEQDEIDRQERIEAQAEIDGYAHIC